MTPFAGHQNRAGPPKTEVAAAEFVALRAAETIGRPLGDDALVARVETTLGRIVRRTGGPQADRGKIDRPVHFT